MTNNNLNQVIGFLETYGAGFLKNISADGVCDTCSAPTNGQTLCIACGKNYESGIALADRVRSLTYAIGPEKSDQPYKIMRGYKSFPPNPRDVLFVASLLRVALQAHSRCLMRISNTQSRFKWATVPSTSKVDVQHPINKIVAQLSRSIDAEVPVETNQGKANYRILDKDNFTIASVVAGDHVLVIDDSWVSGAHAQSVAAALKAKGAAEVSILTVARVLNATWEPNKLLLSTLENSRTFDPNVCPWQSPNCREK